MVAKIYSEETKCKECGRTKKNLSGKFCRGMCKVCYDRWLRHTNPAYQAAHNNKGKIHRDKHGDIWRKKHRETTRAARRTIVGFLQSKYQSMKRRVIGRTDRKDDSWRGKPICTQMEFFEWSLRDPYFQRLFKLWVKHQDSAHWCSIDRIDNSKGYTIDNMRWVTHSENSSGPKPRKFKIKKESTVSF